MIDLSEGCVMKMYLGEKVAYPVLQIFNIQRIVNNKEDIVNRYRLTLGDNQAKIDAIIFRTHKTNKELDYVLNENDIGSVIKLYEYSINIISNEVPKVIIGLSHFEIICKQEFQCSNERSDRLVECNIIEKKTETSTFNGCQILSIDKLNPFQNKWSIKAKCYKKTPIKPCPKNPNLNYCIAEFMDSSGKIKLIEFGNDCSKLSEVREGGIYLISDCLVKSTNKLYSNPINKYELTITQSSVISLFKMSVSVVPLCELINKKTNDIVDVIGIIKEVQETSFTISNSAKRVVCILDEHVSSFSVTLWGETTERFEGVQNQVILIKQARIGNYNGKNLNVSYIDQIEINPDMPEARELLHWFNQTRNSTETMQENHAAIMDRKLDSDCDQNLVKKIKID